MAIVILAWTHEPVQTSMVWTGSVPASMVGPGTAETAAEPEAGAATGVTEPAAEAGAGEDDEVTAPGPAGWVTRPATEVAAARAALVAPAGSKTVGPMSATGAAPTDRVDDRTATVLLAVCMLVDWAKVND